MNLVAPARPVVALPVQRDARREVRPEIRTQVEAGALLVGHGARSRQEAARDEGGSQSRQGSFARDGREARFHRISSKSGASGTTPARAAIENSTRRAASPESPMSRVSAETYIFTNWRPSSRSRPRPKREGVVERLLLVRVGPVNARPHRAIHLGRQIPPQVAPHDVEPERQRQPVLFLEPDAEIREQVEPARLVGQLPLVDDDPRVGSALFHRLENLVEGHHDRFELPDEAPREESRRGPGAGERHPAPLQVLEVAGFPAYHDRAVPLAHARAARHDPVAIRHREIGVRGDRGDREFAGDSAIVQALDVFEDMFHLVIADAHRALGEGAEHEGVVWIGAVPDAQDGRRGHGLVPFVGVEGRAEVLPSTASAARATHSSPQSIGKTRSATPAAPAR